MLNCWAHEEECDNKIGSSFFYFFLLLFLFKLKFEKSLNKILFHIFIYLSFLYFFRK